LDKLKVRNIIIIFSISAIVNKENTQIFYYGSLEKRFFKEFKSAGFDLNLKVTHDVLSIISNSIYFPTLTNNLKDICQYLGFYWDDEIQTGIQSIIIRKEWEKQQQQIFKDQLIAYNKNDCKALMFLVDTLRKLEHDNEKVTDIKSLKKESVFKWRNTNDYFEKELNEINKLSYFTYNQDKVYVRTNKRSRKRLIKRKSFLIKKYKPNEIIEVFPEKCPKCRTRAKKNLNNRITTVSRTVSDLKFIKNGIKRWIIQYKGGKVQCLNCSHVFSTKNVLYIKTCGDNLKKYCVNQHISYRVSFNSIAESLSHFNIYISETRVFEFKREFAQKYAPIYDELRKELLGGHLIQIDETEIKLDKKQKGYVWVFSNMDTVYYLYRENRKTAFLKEFLEGFSGVVLSDFYSGYDSLHNLQQKCLVHLLRDLNSDFYHNQQDDELKSIVKKFGALLREVVNTIDTFGLRKRNLNKHIKQVEKFYKDTFNKEFKSDLAYKYQKRFLKYKEKLFTFLHYNNVPWHNNNAEYAIKAFAQHRKRGNRIFTESSTGDYAILLSLEQTCKYRGIKFMDFLMNTNKLK
jgi:hypothetical protein